MFLISNVRTSASKKINLMALIRTLTILTTTFENMKEKFYGFWQTEWSNWFETRHVDLAKFFNMDKGPIIFFVCVCVWGGGKWILRGRGNRKKADLVKGGIKFGRNMVRGERNYEFVQGGIRFLIIWMYNKVLNGQSKPCLQDLLSEQHQAKQLSVSYTFFRLFQILCW